MTASETLVLGTLSQDAFVLVNKKLVRFFDGDGTAATFLSELISAYKYHVGNQSIEPDGAFAIPIKRYEIILGLSPYKQDRVLKKLSSIGVAHTRLIGFPAVKHVRLEFDKIAQILLSDALEYKQIEKAEFYDALNEAFNTNNFTKSTIIAVEQACHNMSPVLRGTIILMSRYWAKDCQATVRWTSPLIGKITTWGRRRALGKAFDFSIVTRTLDHMAANGTDASSDSFEEFVNNFITTAKGVQDVHYIRQELEYTTLIED